MLLTDQGDFETLAHLRLAYLEAYHGNPPVEEYFNSDEWDDSTLHISELGKCPRQQMYRLLDEEKQPEGISARANKELMFWQGNMIHALTVGALEWGGILVAFEKQLPGLPAGWSGHYDAIFKDREDDQLVGWDGKTVRPNNFNYSYEWPKPEQVAQARGYLRFIPDVPYWLIEYIDRGGSKTPQTRVIERNDVWVDDSMITLALHRERLPELPPMLGPEFKISYRKVNNEPKRRGNTVSVGPSWQCEWCPYHHGLQDPKTKEWYTYPESPCKPAMERLQVGSTSKGMFRCTAPQYDESLTLWLKDQVWEYPIEEEDVE